ncbi:hypothetical protein [Faecalibacter rhinopitheci]|uniref:Uncharacterized protein n=1 Tax=Faecalibacter rhinopitheci TaxID=2779678 RepID=A0A8J7FN46_9FLAO|nr:hypothetical protein [Faecalibacter rhinopitheci]MBF0597487.1 hypothetical protein [Faecalibacter rhinopitheci]
MGKKTRPYFLKRNKFFPHYVINSKKRNINDLLYEKIIEGNPLMVARFGSVESRSIVNYLTKIEIKNDFIGILKFLTGEIGINWKNSKNYLDQLCLNAGFFPNNEELLTRFINLYLHSSKDLDILGVWNELEEYIPTIPENVNLCNIRELEPWFFSNPWTKALEGKKVLIIHPFENTIKLQYKNRQNIYLDLDVLPDFELLTIKAVQSIADEKSEFNNWFDALEDMKIKIDNLDFDVAILGCGAYGFPLASYIKNIGKQAIHLGGVTQLLFGIKGKRWEDWEHYTSLRGKGWVYASEKPKGFNKIENGCYW